jgi:mannose-6-phosphate isomerase-like protein (cupin superfamily)
MPERIYKDKYESKPWGYELLWAHTGRYAGKILHINRGYSLSLQYHNVKEESVRLLSGRMTMYWETDGEKNTVEMKPGDCLHIATGMVHQMIAIDDCDVLEVSTPELGDVIRVKDPYNR